MKLKNSTEFPVRFFDQKILVERAAAHGMISEQIRKNLLAYLAANQVPEEDRDEEEEEIEEDEDSGWCNNDEESEVEEEAEVE